MVRYGDSTGASRSRDEPFAALEARVLLSQTMLDHEIFYPEGYAHPGIEEVVTVTNGSGVEAEFELIARYETGERDQVLAAGTIAPDSFRDIEIVGGGEFIVRHDDPYSLVLRSSEALAADLQHDDFGGSTREAFTSTVGTFWSFHEVVKGGSARDFIVFYNPGESAVTVTVTGVSVSGESFTLESTIDAKRRGGWNLAAEDSVPDGHFGVIVSSTDDVAVGLSHYYPGVDASGSLGDPDGGARAGAIFDVEFSGSRRGLGAGNNSGIGEVDDTRITIFNPGRVEANVEIVFFNRDETNPLSGGRRSITVDARSRFAFDLSSLNFPPDAELALVYESDQAVTVGATVRTDRGRVFAVEAVDTASTQWEFTTPILNTVQNGLNRTDELYVFNPTGETVDVTIEFFYANGEMVTETMTIGSLDFGEVDASGLPPSRGGGRPFFGVRMISSSAIVVGMEYWSRDARDIFDLARLASGRTAPLSSVLAL